MANGIVDVRPRYFSTAFTILSNKTLSAGATFSTDLAVPEYKGYDYMGALFVRNVNSASGGTWSAFVDISHYYRTTVNSKWAIHLAFYSCSGTAAKFDT